MYNLLDKPFIRAFYPDGSQKELGITDIFKESKEIARIGGDSPTDEVALLRLLLAILYRSMDVNDEQDWEEVWENGLPLDDICTYLEEYRGRFELLDSPTPFYQILNAQYTTKGKEPDNMYLLLSHQTHGSNNDSLYSPFKYDRLQKLNLAFSARRLVDLQAFNTGAKKSPIEGDSRKSSHPKKYAYAQPGWLSNGSTVHALGKNLEQTLLLNFVPYNELGIDYEDDLPVWEREPHTSSPEGAYGELAESRTPSGPADLYTHQSSRITLYTNGTEVTGSVVGIGDRIFKYNLESIEPMMAWKQIKRETKEIAFTPVKQTENKDSWRSLNALLGHNSTVKLSQRKPKNLEWVSGRILDSITPVLGNSIPVMVTSVFYGPQDAVISNKVVSLLDISNEILVDDSLASATAFTALTMVENYVYAYSNLIANILVAEGKEKSPAKGTKALDIAKNHTHELLRELGAKYNHWINGITQSNATQELEQWNDLVYKTTKDMGTQVINNASRLAIAGRKVDKENFMNSSIAANIFYGTLYNQYTGKNKKGK